MEKVTEPSLAALLAGCTSLLLYRDQLLTERQRLLQERQKLLEQRKALLEDLQSYKQFFEHCKQWFFTPPYTNSIIYSIIYRIIISRRELSNARPGSNVLRLMVA